MDWERQDGLKKLHWEKMKGNLWRAGRRSDDWVGEMQRKNQVKKWKEGREVIKGRRGGQIDRGKRGRGRFEIWSQRRYWWSVWWVCVFHHALSVGAFMLKNTHTDTLTPPPDFISQTTCRALGVIGCPFSLLMARGEERRGENRRWTSRITVIY